MRRFFYTISDHKDDDLGNNGNHFRLSSLAVGDSVNLTSSITHHWCKVLRANVGDKGVLFDGFGGEYQVQLQTISKKTATAIILSYDNIDRAPALTTKIALVMSRGERMDYAIQKSTELGVTAIQLLTSQRGEVNLKPAQIEKKLAHWQQIAIAACEQCGLNRVPLIIAPLSLEGWLHGLDTDTLDAKALPLSSSVVNLSQDPYYQVLISQTALRLVLSAPLEDQLIVPTKIVEILAQPLPFIELLIGPEGGFSPDEVMHAQRAGFEAWQIGNRVLRTETAPVVALATLHALSHIR